nr:transcription termination/antitermination NusG family protein [Paracraurococcus ruber]
MRVTNACGHTNSASVAAECGPAAGPEGSASPQVPKAPGVRKLSEPRWYCVEAYPNQQREVRARLVQLGFEVLMPLGCRVLGSGVLVTPLFGQYLFVRFDAVKGAWRRICYTRGVRRIFGSSPEAPHPMDPAHMRLIQGLPVRGLDMMAVCAGGMPEIGQPFRIVAGPWRGCVGICLDVVGGGVRALAFLRAGPGEVELPAKWCRLA